MIGISQICYHHKCYKSLINIPQNLAMLYRLQVNLPENVDIVFRLANERAKYLVQYDQLN